MRTRTAFSLRAARIGALTAAFCLHILGYAQLTVSLAPADHNGYHISCNGGADGAIDLSVSGGTPPYTYDWSTGATTQDVSGLRAGFISVRVTDAASNAERVELTLTEPDKLEGVFTPFVYTGGYNISCHSCFNGSIAVTITGGVPTYTYAWVDGPTTEDRAQLDAGNYQVDVTDANGCVYRGPQLTLTQPERDDWTKSGNAGTTPGTHFIGTTDNKDVVFKSNGTESLRLKSNGDIRIGGSVTGFGLLYRDIDGTLRAGSLPNYPPIPNEPCRDLGYYPYWRTDGNSFDLLCPEDDPVLGTLDERPLNLITHGELRMQLMADGRVLIGDASPGTSALYKLIVEGGIATRDVKVMSANFPDYVFRKDYALMPLNDVRRYIRQHGHLPHLPSAAEVSLNAGFELGDVQLRVLRTVEEQALYILQLEEKLERMEQRLRALETSKH